MNSTGVDNATCPAEGNGDISDSCTLRTSTRLAVYGALVYSTVIIHFVRGLIFYLVCINASKTLHNRMFSNILRVPVHFFDTNASGKFLFLGKSSLFCCRSLIYVLLASTRHTVAQFVYQTIDWSKQHRTLPHFTTVYSLYLIASVPERLLTLSEFYLTMELMLICYTHHCLFFLPQLNNLVSISATIQIKLKGTYR